MLIIKIKWLNIIEIFTKSLFHIQSLLNIY